MKRFATCLLLTIAWIPAAQAENLDHVRQLLSTKQCQTCELSGTGLVFAQLSGADLSQANLARANFSQAMLAGANLSGANLSGASLNGANLSGAKLSGADLSGADLRNAILVGADLTGARLENTALQGAIGLAPTLGNPEDFYRWAMEAMKLRNYERAIENFNQVLVRKPDYALAYFGRGVAQLEMGNKAGAIADSEQAATLFAQQGNTTNAEEAKKLAQLLKTPPKEEKGSSLGQSIISTVGGLMQLFLGL